MSICNNLFKMLHIRNYLHLVLVCICVSSTTIIFAQSPGGVSGNMGLWLKAGDLPTSTNTTANWTSATYTPATPGVWYEVVQDINSNNSVHINDEWFEHSLDLNVPTVNVFTVYRPAAAPTSTELWGNGGAAAGQGKQATTTTMTDGTAPAQSYSNGNTPNKVYINHMDINNTSNSFIWLNGTQETSFATGNTNAGTLHNGTFIARSSNTGVPGNMNIAEFIAYTGTITAIERERINSYLAIKYGITLPHNYTINNGNTLVWTQLSNTGYTNDITAIARDGGSGLNQPSSKSENANSMLTISTINAIPNNEGLAVGNNGGLTSTASNFQEAKNFFAAGQRLDKVWKCQKTANFSNNVDISINTTLPSGFTNKHLVLLIANDPNFTNDLRAYPITSSGTIRNASDVSLDNGNYFTIAYSSSGAMWIKADGSNNLISGSSVNQLGDHVFGLNNMTGTVIGSSSLPVRTAGTASSSINFNPYITLNQNSQRNYVEKSNFIGLGQSGTSSFLVLRRDNNNSPNPESIMSYAYSNTDHNEWLIEKTNNIEVFIEGDGNNNNSNLGIHNNINRPHILTNINGNSTNRNLRRDGENANLSYSNNDIIRSGGTLIFGQEQDNLGGGFNPNQEYNGNLAEAIILNKKAGPNELNAVESYLAVKYGITLVTDYQLSDNTTTWDRSNNSGGGVNYNHNIAGIGRDDLFQLDQKKSRSQNGNNVDVTIEHLGAFTNNLSHLIWGCDNCNDYNTVSSNNAPSLYKISKKQWKVQNTGVGIVNVTLDIPPTLSSLNAGSIRLLVSNNTIFSSGTVTNYSGSISSGTITFSNVTLPDNHYFTLGSVENISYVNHDPLAPNSFEACAGSNVTFEYSNLNAHPDQVQLMDTTGTPIIVTGTINQTSSSPYNGSINIIIPGDAGTGNVILLDGNTSVYNFNTNLVVHNPQLDFFAQASPVCATDIVPLIGFPAGGTFSSIPSSLVLNGKIRGAEGGWSNLNDSAKSFPITYTYTPLYLDQITPCFQSVSKTNDIEIRDNRIDELTFNYIIKDSSTSKQLLRLDTVTISSVSPNFLDPSFNFPITFSGTYVTPPFFSTTYEFLTGLADERNSVTLRYYNGGCIGEASADIDVFPRLRIIGLLDTMCTEANAILFGRDTLPEYAYDSSGISQQYTNYSVAGSLEKNKITKVITQNPAYQIAIGTISTTNNAESYSFTPSNITSPVDTIIIEMHYTTTRIQTVTVDTITLPTDTIISSIIAFDTIHMIPRPVPDIGGFDSIYCENTIADPLLPSPFFESPTRTYFKFIGNDGLAYTLSDTLLNDTLFDPSYHYNKHVPNQNRHFEVQLVYIVDRHGCFDTDTAYTTIIAPVQPIFTPQLAYCVSDFPTPLTPSYAPQSFPPVGGSGVFFSIPGLDTTTNLFDPGLSAPGYHEATYQFTDNFGCVSSYSDTLYVREPPLIKLEAGGPNNNAFCSNQTNIQLQTILLPSTNTLDSVRYFGAGITNNIFDPSAVFPNSSGGPSAGGNSQIWNLYVDSFGCAGRDTLDIIIREIPRLRIDSLFNDTRRYCNNHQEFVISGFVDSSGYFVKRTGAITGNAITFVDSTYYYDPNIVSVDSVFHDTVSYIYTDEFNCSNVVNITITIDSVPELFFTGLDDNYCINYPTDQLIGSPDSNSLNNQIVFGGPGINPNTGVFNPANSGTGQKIMSYTFENSRSCSETIYDTTTIHALPIPLFGGYENQYCSAAANDTLSSLNNATLGSSFRFWGRIIVDTIGILDPGNDSSGVIAIYYEYTDSLNCSNTDSTNIFIHPSPEITISGLDSAYCFNAPEDNIAAFPPGGRLDSANPGFSLGTNNIIFDPDEDTAGIKTFTYIYSDPFTTCADTVSGSTIVEAPPTPSFTGLDTFYCENKDTFPIAGLPAYGVFTGQGIVDTFGFNPAKAGGGLHPITYTVNDTSFHGTTNLSLVCVVDTVVNVRVRPLPVPTISSPGNNHRFCSTDSDTLLEGISGAWWESFTGGVSGGVTPVIDTTYIPIPPYRIIDTFYYFSPDSVVEGTHFITYIAMNSYGCQDSVQYTYIVDEYSQPRFALDSVFCESEDSVILFGVPGGGVFTRDNDTLNGAPPYFIPNPNYNISNLTASALDTIIYTVQDGACYGTDTQIVRINPVPILSFTGTFNHNTYCLGLDTIPLTPNIQGGVFSGAGVLFGRTDFIPNIAGAGHHVIYYNYTDPFTNCSNEFTDTFSVFGMPKTSFDVVGGCQRDSILFLPDNLILGLNNIFNNQIIDSITHIRWEFEPNDTLIGTSQNNQIDSVYHRFNSPGIYDTKLYVTNQLYCADTHNVRLVISPTIAVTKYFPYDESFETSDGNWYAESRDDSHSQLWEWGIDSTASGIPSDLNNRFWATQSNNSYSENEDAWVYGPCFDISSLNRPMIKLDYWSDTRPGFDGTVLEYQKADGTWSPIGERNRGINWFDTDIITGQPGDQNLAPTGWSVQNSGWTDGRYKLDEFKNNDVLRLRFAFGSYSLSLGGSFYDGFGFDNVWIGNRTRNVLLETTSNISEPNMGIINNYVYQLVFHTSINKDLVLLQYHPKYPTENDAFYKQNKKIGTSRAFYYSGNAAASGKSFIDGFPNRIFDSRYLQAIDFEQDMLKSPKFNIKIDDPLIRTQNSISTRAVVTAMEDMPPGKYNVNIVFSEDSLTYSSGEVVHAVVRESNQNPNDSSYIFNQSWTAGDSIEIIFDWNHNANPNYNPANFQAVVFIELHRGEVFQAETSRDVSGYLIGVNKVEAKPELEEIIGMNLYPNPARDYFQVDFDKELTRDYKWRLVDLRGVEVRSGIIPTGSNTLEVSSYDLPTGVYIFVASNDHVFSQRKVVINQD